MKTKSIAILLGLAMTASLTGCGGTDSQRILPLLQAPRRKAVLRLKARHQRRSR